MPRHGKHAKKPMLRNRGPKKHDMKAGTVKIHDMKELIVCRCRLIVCGCQLIVCRCWLKGCSLEQHTC